MAAFHHGISAQEVVQGILPMRNANVSVIGLVVTSTDADADMYPLNIPVLLTGITQDNLDKAGVDGTLFNCLQTIRDIHNPTLVILRVDAVFDVDLLDILLTCPTRFGLMPKRLGAPEIDTPEVVLKLVSIAKDRRAIVYASPRKADGSLITDNAEIVAYRDTFGDRELCLIDGEWGVPGESEVVTPNDFDWELLPLNNLVVIENTNLLGAFFAIEINGVMHNSDKSRDLIGMSIELEDDLYISNYDYGGSFEGLEIRGSTSGIKNVRLIPLQEQKAKSSKFVEGEGMIQLNDGTFLFRLYLGV